MVNGKDGIPGGCTPGGASAAGRQDRGWGSGKAGSIAEKAEGEEAQVWVDDSERGPSRSDKLRLKPCLF